jgi:DnaK suppressor protein
MAEHAGFYKTVRNSLISRKEELIRALDNATCDCKKMLRETGSEKGPISSHQADNDIIGYNAVIGLKSMSSMHIKQSIEDVDEALERLARGEYGSCEECGEEIDGRRLALNLAAKRCAPCEQELETEGKRKKLLHKLRTGATSRY